MTGEAYTVIDPMSGLLVEVPAGYSHTLDQNLIVIFNATEAKAFNYATGAFMPWVLPTAQQLAAQAPTAAQLLEPTPDGGAVVFTVSGADVPATYAAGEAPVADLVLARALRNEGDPSITPEMIAALERAATRGEGIPERSAAIADEPAAEDEPEQIAEPRSSGSGLALALAAFAALLIFSQ